MLIPRIGGVARAIRAALASGLAAVFGATTVTTLTAGAINGMTFRKIASGVGTSCPNATTTVIGPYTRQAGEVVKLFMFPSNSAVAMVWAEGQGPTSIWTDYRRTVNSNEFTFGVANVSGTTAVVDWVLVGITP